MTDALRLLSSRATERLLDALAQDLAASGISLHCESAGGVEVAQRLRDGERADLAVLADDALAGLEDDGIVVPSSRTALFVSEVALAVPSSTTGDVRLESEDDLLSLLRGAGRVAYSTGPSGSGFLDWLEARGLGGGLEDRLVQAPAGTPVARLLADGAADVGVQQLSELADAPGVRVVGPLPGSAAATSTFAGAVLTSSARPREAAAALARLAAPEAAETVRAHHLHPAGS